MKNNLKIKLGNEERRREKNGKKGDKTQNQQEIGNEKGKKREITHTRRHMHIYKYMFVKNFFIVHMFISIDY